MNMTNRGVDVKLEDSYFELDNLNIGGRFLADEDKPGTALSLTMRIVDNIPSDQRIRVTVETVMIGSEEVDDALQQS